MTRSDRPFAVAVLLALGAAATTLAKDLALDQTFGPHVLIFEPSMPGEAIQAALDTVHEQQAHAEFGGERWALLFKPGSYDLEVTVDYYVQAAGLGRFPDQTVIRGSVQSTTTTRHHNVTTMFWRAAENLCVEPSEAHEGMIHWAVSQAAPYRRMHIRGDLRFDRGGWASGGFLANSVVDGQAGTRTGQQWFTRNAELGSWHGGNWNATFVGVHGAPPPSWPQPPVTIVEETPVVREKPFLMVDEAGAFAVFVPGLKRDSSGVSWRDPDEPGERVPLAAFHLARPETDNAASLNAALAAGQHLLLTPGLYLLDDTLRVERPGTIVFGLGFPTLIPQTGRAAIACADVDGVQLAGLVLDAGPVPSPNLLEVGEPGAHRDHAANPTSLHDIFCRVGGLAPGATETCVTIHSDDVIADHFWLWRADHGAGARWETNPCRHGLVVHGDDVTIYGLFNEHCQGYQTLWRGERGRVYFYQSEIPYDPPSNEIWNDDGKPGFASYKVADEVTTHHAWGLGIYSFFRPQPNADAPPEVFLENAIEAPAAPGVVFTHLTTFGGRSGGIHHMINGHGPGTRPGSPTFWEGGTPPNPPTTGN